MIRLLKIVLFGQSSEAKWKAGPPCFGWKDVIKKDLKEIGASLEVEKRKALSILGWGRSVCSCVDLRWPGAAMSC